MKRFLLLIAISFLLSLPSFANHISGGEIYYTYTRQSGNAFLYHITLKLLHTCNSHELNTQAKFTVLNKKTFEVAWDGLAPRTGLIQKFITEPNPCITNPPQICNEVGYYEVDVLLPSSTDGYIIIYENCCRPAMVNLGPVIGSIGAAFIAEIPGTTPVASGPANNSARFKDMDTVMMCANNFFTYDASATDQDGDQLVYSFCDAYTTEKILMEYFSCYPFQLFVMENIIIVLFQWARELPSTHERV